MGVPSSMSTPRTCSSAFSLTNQLHDGKTNRVGTAGRASGKDSVGSIVEGRFADQIEVAGAMKLPEDEEVGESFNVDEPRLEFGQELEYTLGFMFRVQALGNLAGLVVGAAHESDRLGNKHISSCLRLPMIAAGGDLLDAVHGS